MVSYMFIFGRFKEFTNWSNTMDYIAHGPKAKNSPNQLLDLNTSFERSLSKLSENQNIFEI